MDNTTTILSTQALAIGYRQQKLASGLQLQLHAGTLTCLLGPNGAGKSTLMRTLGGIHAPLAGKVLLQGQDIHRQKASVLARMVSVVLTDRIETGHMDAYSVVAMGRYPYTGWLGRLRQQDARQIASAIDISGTAALMELPMLHLSDGEKQKVMIARALAQDTPLILLDEPTAHLDLPSRLHIMHLLQKLAKETGKSVLVSTHDLDLALQCADYMWLMHQHSVWQGIPEDLILSGAIQAVFQKKGMYFDMGSGSFRMQPAYTRMLHLAGEGMAYHWTRKALERAGFRHADEKDGLPLVRVLEQQGKPVWVLQQHGLQQEHTSLESLLSALQTSDV